MASTILNTPIGQLHISASDFGVTAVQFDKPSEEPATESEAAANHVQQTVDQLQRYLDGSLQSFDLTLAPVGTTFQQKVWKELTKIPFGESTSYLKLAQSVSDAKAVRAVGAANGRNPIAIIVPCHRVIGSNGQLVGYAGGLERKEWLLRHEDHPIFKSQQLNLF